MATIKTKSGKTIDVNNLLIIQKLLKTKTHIEHYIEFSKKDIRSYFEESEFEKAQIEYAKLEIYEKFLTMLEEDLGILED